VTTYNAIRVEDRDGIFTVTLDRPEKRNAMNVVMHREMHALLGELRYDPQVRVLIVTGAGSAFCSGQDMSERFDDPREGERARDLSNAWRNDLLRLFHAPTIAAVNGACLGGGISIACVCDIALAAEEASFGLTEVDIGRFPGGLLAKNLAETLSGRELLYYAMTGERFDGKRAAEIGLVTRAVSKDRLDDAVQTLAHTLKEKDPVALRMCKELYKVSARLSYEETYGFANAKVAQGEALQGRDPA